MNNFKIDSSTIKIFSLSMAEQKEALRKQIENEVIKKLRKLTLQSDFYKLFPKADMVYFHIGVEYYDEDWAYYQDIVNVSEKDGYTNDWETTEQFQAGKALAEDFLRTIDERDFYFAFGDNVAIPLDEKK